MLHLLLLLLQNKTGRVLKKHPVCFTLFFSPFFLRGIYVCKKSHKI
jgi:hypothetical protein